MLILHLNNVYVRWNSCMKYLHVYNILKKIKPLWWGVAESRVFGTDVLESTFNAF